MTFRYDIQGLRAIAVLAVMLFHYNRQLLPGGFIGVDIFFVISGFLITSILLRQKDKPNFSLFSVLKNFYFGRIVRIAPAYYVLLVVVSAISAVLFIPKDYNFFYDSLGKSLWFASNQYFSDFGDYFAPTSDELPLLHTWSLAIEMQFYLFYPFLILLLGKKWLKIIIPAMALVFFLFATYQLKEGMAQSVYYGLSARIPEFLIGGCVVLFAQQIGKAQSNWLSIVGVILVLSSFAFINEKTPFPGLYAFPSVLGAALILSDFSGHKVSKFLSKPLFVWVGALSYSLYLWHWPVLAFIRYISGEYELNLTQSVLYWGGAFMLASASYYLIEEYFRRNKANAKNISTKISWGVIISAVILTTAFSSSLNKNLVPPLPVELTRYADPATICHGKIAGDCIRGDRNSKEKPILVLGDSHAAMLNHFFDVVGTELNLSFLVITASSCVTIPNFDYENLPGWAQKPCADQITYAEKFINSAEKIIVAGMWSYQLKENNLTNSINTWLSKLSDEKQLIYFLSDVPQLDNFYPLKNYRFNFLGLPNLSAISIKNQQRANETIKNQLAQHTIAEYIDLHDSPLLDRLSLPTMYFDDNHLHTKAAKLYGKESIPILINYLVADNDENQK